MKIYSTRHGQTDWNKLDVIQGATDIELNETGIAQADELAERVAALGDVGIIIASPMKRAYRTASAVAERTGLPIVTDERLREWDYGRYEKMPRYTENFPEDKVSFARRMGGTGESLLELVHRVYSALDDIISRYADKNVLIVSHGGVCRIIETYFHEMTTEQFLGWFMGNCQIIEYNTNGGRL